MCTKEQFEKEKAEFLKFYVEAASVPICYALREYRINTYFTEKLRYHINICVNQTYSVWLGVYLRKLYNISERDYIVDNLGKELRIRWIKEHVNFEV